LTRKQADLAVGEGDGDGNASAGRSSIQTALSMGVVTASWSAAANDAPNANATPAAAHVGTVAHLTVGTAKR
jgi:hypothetical protein